MDTLPGEATLLKIAGPLFGQCDSSNRNDFCSLYFPFRLVHFQIKFGVEGEQEGPKNVSFVQHGGKSTQCLCEQRISRSVYASTQANHQHHILP